MTVRIQASLRVLQQLISPEPIRTVMLTHNRQTHRVRILTGRTQTRNQHQVAAGLAHLVAVQTDHAGVRVMLSVRTCRHSPRMARTQIMVRERQIVTARLNGQRTIHKTAGNHRALDVPAGAARAQLAGIPARLALTLNTPQQRIQCVTLTGTVRVAAALSENLQHLITAQVADLAGRPRVALGIRGQLTHSLQIQVHVTVRMHHTLLVRETGHAVRQAAAEQVLNQREQPLNGLHHTHIVRRRNHVQRLHVGAEQLRLILSQLTPINVRRGRTLKQRVVHIGHVLNVRHRHARIQPGAVQQVKSNIGGGVTHMRRVVRGDTANVQARRLILLNLNNLTSRSIKNTRQRSLTGQSHRGRGIPSSHGFPFRKNAHNRWTRHTRRPTQEHAGAKKSTPIRIPAREKLTDGYVISR